MSTYAVVNPATGETLATYPTLSDDEVQAAIAKAYEAQRAWREVPVAERAAKIRRVADLHRERSRTTVAEGTRADDAFARAVRTTLGARS